MQTVDEQEMPGPEEQDAPGGQPNGGNPDQMIGYIPDQASAKVKTYLLTAKAVILNPQTASILKQMLAGGNDMAMTLATFVGKTIDSIETKLGPLTPQEHDQVALIVTGWLVSSLQKMGAPGLEDQGARHDLLGRILQALDQLTQGDQQQDPNAPTPDQGAAPPDAQAQPLAQFGGA